jgi:hypothetical protein
VELQEDRIKAINSKIQVVLFIDIVPVLSKPNAENGEENIKYQLKLPINFKKVLLVTYLIAIDCKQ